MVSTQLTTLPTLLQTVWQNIQQNLLGYAGVFTGVSVAFTKLYSMAKQKWQQHSQATIKDAQTKLADVTAAKTSLETQLTKNQQTIEQMQTELTRQAKAATTVTEQLAAKDKEIEKLRNEYNTLVRIKAENLKIPPKVEHVAWGERKKMSGKDESTADSPKYYIYYSQGPPYLYVFPVDTDCKIYAVGRWAETKTILKLAAFLIIGVLIGAVVAIAVQQYVFPTTGTVTTVSLTIAWLDGGAPVSTIAWGPCENSTEYELEPLNITNTSNVPVTLNLATSDLSTSIITLDLTWNYSDTKLEPNESIILALTQNVTATGDYTYNTIIDATEA